MTTLPGLLHESADIYKSAEPVSLALNVLIYSAIYINSPHNPGNADLPIGSLEIQSNVPIRRLAFPAENKTQAGRLCYIP
jgi:hypothetical protein